MSTSRFPLPLRIEREYEAFRARIQHDVGRVGTRRLLTSRVDASDDPQIEELAMLLGLSAAALVDEQKLRAKLRRFAKRLSAEKRLQLTALIGTYVEEPDEAIIDMWVEEQSKAISEQVDGWLARAAIAVGALAVTRNVVGAAFTSTIESDEVAEAIAIGTAAQATRARAAASNAVLELNTQLLGSAATSAGLTEYRWVTEDDDRVRENHFELHYTIQKWSDPPMGGGTKPDEVGHPGEGFGCRCIAEPVIA